MGPDSQRQRSETVASAASSRRPKSRASTTSIHSASTQAAPQHQTESHPVTNSNAHPNLPVETQYTQEEIPSRQEQDLNILYRGFVEQHQIQNQNGQQNSVGMEHEYSSHMPNASASGQWQAFGGRDPHAFGQTNEQGMQEDTGASESKRKKGSASSMANDQELRRLYRENKGRTLKDVASHVLANERGPRSEKTKQIFAMLWLAEKCRKSTNSVPRNRVFSHYATQCGTERVAPLNPASFGKLVRIIFPGIQTRRLGMRGESKYHYVDLSLVDDQSSLYGGQLDQARREGSTAPERPGIPRQRSLRPADTAAFPSPHLPIEPLLSRNTPTIDELQGSLFLDNTGYQGEAVVGTEHDMCRRSIKFPTGERHALLEADPLELPSIHGYVPHGTDADAAEALTALYRSHCISVIDSFRYCKEKMLWHHFSSFHGTLTVPVQKLFAHPHISPWIKACDFLMYQKMISFVSPLALQVVPLIVLKTFKAISTKLTRHIISVFQTHPLHVRKARLFPATVFANLLDRLARVNEAAHAAANMLTNDANREQMWQDWVHHVRAKHVAQDTLTLRTTEMLKIVDIVVHDIKELLTPLTTYQHPTALELYNAPRYFPQNTSSYAAPPLEDPAEGILDRWANFLYSLPARFPKADGKMIVHYMTLASDAAIRDITVAQAPSFGSWWITKVWVDEMLLWLVENGGFMDYDPADPGKSSRSILPTGFAAAEDAMSEFLGDDSRPQTAMSGSAAIAHSRMGSVDQGPTALHQQHQHQARVSSVPPSLHALHRPELPRSNSVHHTQSHSTQISPSDIGLGFQMSTTTNTQQGGGGGIDSFRSFTSAQSLSGGPLNAAKSQSHLDANEDSGIVMDDDAGMRKIDAFVTNSSDPVNVAVC